MSTYCQVDGICDHGSQQVGKASSCMCSFSGPQSCPGCGHSCEPWYSGVEIPGHRDLTYAFLDTSETVKFPATGEAIMGELQHGSSGYDVRSSGELGWMQPLLSGKTFSDMGEVLTSLMPAFEWTPKNALQSGWKTGADRFSTGTKLMVKDGQLAVLVDQNGRVLQSFGPGNYTLTAENCPEALKQSRPPAQGYVHSLISASITFFATGKMQIPFSANGTSRSGKPISATGKLSCSVTSPSELLANAGSDAKLAEPTSFTGFLSGILNGRIASELNNYEADALNKNASSFQSALSSKLDADGIKLEELNFDYVGIPNAQTMFSGIGQGFPGGMFNVEQMKKMAETMRSQAGMRPTKGPGVTAQGAGTTVPCPACGNQNPSGVKFCGTCGKPMAAAKCPSCGAPVSPGIKFCGSCGKKIV